MPHKLRVAKDIMMRKGLQKIAALAVAGYGSTAFAAGGGVSLINYYQILLHNLGLDEHAIGEWQAVAGALLSLCVITVIGFFYKRAVENAADPTVPDGRFSIRSIVDSILEFISNLARNLIGQEEAKPFLPLLCGLFIFIFVSNLSGLIPGFVPPTESINTSLALAVVVFIVYQIAGVKEHGASYIKQFLGPVVFLAPLMFIIELVAHLARPLSLSLRLYGNIFGDHLVLSVFTGLTYLVLPAFLLFFGLLVASLQSFVFTLLSSIYISMAISHDH